MRSIILIIAAVLFANAQAYSDETSSRRFELPKGASLIERQNLKISGLVTTVPFEEWQREERSLGEGPHEIVVAYSDYFVTYVLEVRPGRYLQAVRTSAEVAEELDWEGRFPIFVRILEDVQLQENVDALSSEETSKMFSKLILMSIFTVGLVLICITASSYRKEGRGS